MTDLLLATSNPGKVADFQELLSAYLDNSGIRLLTPRDFREAPLEVDEAGATFLENAGIKARAYAAHYGLPVMADDSGLCVDVLGGEPGIHSAPSAGPTDADRNQALLSRLEDVPDENRSAHFICALCLALPSGDPVEAEGACFGRILRQPQGTGGFGYDPLFLLPALGLTFAQLSPVQKNQHSHRARAMQILAPQIACLLGTFSEKSG